MNGIDHDLMSQLDKTKQMVADRLAASCWDPLEKVGFLKALAYEIRSLEGYWRSQHEFGGGSKIGSLELRSGAKLRLHNRRTKEYKETPLADIAPGNSEGDEIDMFFIDYVTPRATTPAEWEDMKVQVDDPNLDREVTQ